MADLSVNGQPLAALGFYLYEVNDLRSRAGHKYPVTPLWGRAGGWATWPSVTGRTLTMKGRIVTTANTVAARGAAEHVLKDWVGNAGLAQLIVDDDANAELAIDALLEELTIEPIGHPLQAVASEVTMRWNAPDPLWSATSETIIGAPVTNTRYSLPLGTAPSTPILRLMGSATNPTATIRDSGGTAQVTVAVTLTLASTDYLDIDCRTGQTTLYVSGSGSSGATYYRSYFALDPAWGDVTNSRWPTLETSAGQAEILYVKRYW